MRTGCFAYKRNSCTALKVKSVKAAVSIKPRSSLSWVKKRHWSGFVVWMRRGRNIFLKNITGVKEHECQGIFIASPMA